MMILTGTGIVLLLVLGVAWYDGGRQEQRQVVQPVELPGAAS